jgi:hypothetical protein
MVAYGLVRYEDGVEEPRSAWVVGALVEHKIDRDGYVTGSSCWPAVWNPEVGEFTSAEYALGDGVNAALVGVYANGVQPPAEDIAAARSEITDKIRRYREVTARRARARQQLAAAS